MQETQIIKECKRGDANAFNSIFERYKKMVYLVALQMTGSKEEALDITQITFMKAFKNLARFNPRKALKPWLLSIVRNQCIDHLRHQKIYKQQELNNASWIEDKRYDPSLLLDKDEIKTRLWQALKLLDPIHKEVIILKDMHDLSYKQISKILKIPAGTVMSRLAWARSRLKGLLNGVLYD